MYLKRGMRKQFVLFRLEFVLFAKSHKKSEAVNASDCKVIKSRNYSAVGEAIPPKVIEAT